MARFSNYLSLTIVALCCFACAATGAAGMQATTGLASDWGEDQYSLAAQHYRQQRWPQAIGQFRLLLDRDPDHARAPLAKFFLAESHVQLEQYSESVPYFEAFLEQEPKHALANRAKFRLGEAFYLMGSDDDAIQHLTTLLALDTEKQFAEFTLAYLGEMLLKRQPESDIASARDYLQRMVRDYPESALLDRSRLGLAQAMQKLGDATEAEVLLTSLRSSSDQMIAEEATLVLAALWMEQDRSDSVLELLSDETLNKLSAAQLPTAKYWRGRAEMSRKNWAAAASLIVDCAPQLEDGRLQQAAFYDAAICHWQANELEQAERLLNQSLERWPTGDWAAECRFLLLQAAVRAPNDDQIAEHAQAFLTQFPAHAFAGKVRETLARRALGTNDYAEAETQFRSLLESELAPSANELDRATWYHLLGLSQIGLGNLDQGLISLDASLKLLPVSPSDPRPETLEVWLRDRVPEPVSPTPTAEQQLREQVEFARASVLTRQQRWSDALEAQAAILSQHPESRFRYQLWADHLRALAALQDWGNYQAAAELTKSWLAINSENKPVPTTADLATEKQVLLEAWYATSLVFADHCYEQQDFVKAIAAYDLASNAEDEAVVEQALSGLAWSEFQSRRTAESEATARVLLDRFSTSPRSAEVGLKLVEQWFRDGRFQSAEELVKLLLDRFPSWPRRHQLLAVQAKLWAKKDDPNSKRQARQTLQAALDALSSNSAESVATEAGSANSTMAATYWYELAWLHHENGDAVAARNAFEQINVAYPTSRYWADATLRLAQEHFAGGRLAQAKDLIRQLLPNENAGELNDALPRESKTDSVPALSASFRAAKNEPNPKDAATNGAASTGATMSNELKSHALYLQAMIAVAEKDWVSAGQSAERLIQEFPDHRLRWMTQFWSGEALFRQRKFEAAVRQLSEVLPRTSDRTEPWVAMAHLRLAQSLGHLDRWDDVLVVAEPAKLRFKEFTQAFELDYLIGRALATDARFPQARAAYQQVIDSPHGKNTETAAMAQWMIGETYFHQEQYALASEAYHRTETLYPFPQWQAAALLQAGKCYEHLKRPQDAISVYRQLLSEHANCSLSNQAQERLERLKPDQRRLVPANPLSRNRLRGS
ncbi:MAG: tetratricopeptide repeat protein [Planctomycetaceae bacterium]|nr:tetratricopeptide repeat protein [Planctomycetaceae bacterium]